MGTGCECSGKDGLKLIFACSGAADVGELSDRAARKMTADGTGKMFCMAGIGGKVDFILETTRSADKVLALDGCPMDCVKRSLENAGFAEFATLRVTDCGFEKGKTDVNEDAVAEIAEKAAELLG